MSWRDQATAISPLLACAETGAWGGEAGVLDRIFSLIPHRAGFAVEFGQRAIGSGTVAPLVAQRGWSALYMDEAVVAPERRVVSEQAAIVLARERVLPSNINRLFEKHAVPADLDCLVIDIDGLDYWVWDALDARYAPSLVVVEFNAHVDPSIAASIAPDETWSYRSSKDYGASLAALRALGTRKGYRLIHVHGPWNLYFLKNDIEFPVALGIGAGLTAADHRVLTDTVSFYEALCGAGKRPSWFDAPAPDVARSPWQILVASPPTRQVDLEGIRVEVLADKYDGTWYLQRKTFEEKVSLLYRFVADEGFVNFVDVGANCGFVSMLARRAAPGINLLAVEADPRLARLVEANFVANGLQRPLIVNAIAGERDAPTSPFSLNPTSTLDNRVHVPDWQQISVPMLKGDTLLERHGVAGRTFFKIDTQGFELQVLRGLERYLACHDDWVLKMEFAPDWLRSQGTDPRALLDYLQLRYEFAEFAERIAFGTPGLDALFAHPIDVRRHDVFLDHVTSLNKGGLGWVDLIVRPRLRSAPLPSPQRP